jgi:hypothetical protein
MSQGAEGTMVSLTMKKASGKLVDLTGTRMRCGDCAHDAMSVVSAAPSVTPVPKVRSFQRIFGCSVNVFFFLVALII